MRCCRRARCAIRSSTTAAPAADLTGRWDVRIEYAAGSSMHVLHLRQKGNEIDGTHQGDFVARDLAGTISGSDVRIRSNYGGQSGDSLPFTFTGTADRATRCRASSTWASIWARSGVRAAR